MLRHPFTAQPDNFRMFYFTSMAHCSDVIMGPMTYQITGVMIVHSTVWSGAEHIKHQSSVSLDLSISWRHHEMCSELYEVRDLFPWEMFTKMVISCLLNVEKIWNSAQLNLSSTLNFYRRYVLDVIISTEKLTSEIDADLAQNDM